MVIGHKNVVISMKRRLWPVTLLVGPPSVGKRTIAEHAAAHHGAQRSHIALVVKLDPDAARRVVRMSDIHFPGPFKMVIIRLDGAHDNALNILLKLLEEPPSTFRFVLLSPKMPIPTICSRSVLSRCGYLKDSEVAKVLALSGMDESAAAKAAMYGGGQVRPAMEADSIIGLRGSVNSVLRATAAHDMESLERMMRKWDDAAHLTLIRWAYEAASGRWRFFSHGESSGLADGEFPYKLLVAASSSQKARPRLAAMTALEEECLTR